MDPFVVAGIAMMTAAMIVAEKRRRHQEWLAAGGQIGPTPTEKVLDHAPWILAVGNFVRGMDLNRVTDSGRVSPHWGADVSAPLGTSVFAARAGTVVQGAGQPVAGYGNLVAIRHDVGVTTVYCHLNRAMVEAGQTVTAGQIIGEVGRTTHGPGGAPPTGWTDSALTSMGTHLHFEVHRGAAPNWTAPRLDPVAWLRSQGIAYAQHRRTDLSGAEIDSLLPSNLPVATSGFAGLATLGVAVAGAAAVYEAARALSAAARKR